MRCKKHLVDHSSSFGVCATCLRERLLAVIAAQAQAQEESDQAHQNPNTNFPRSVSPYISRRKSASTTATWHHHQIPSYHNLPDPKFFSTPQNRPTRGIFTDQYKKKKSNKFGFFSSLFRSKSSKPATDSSSTTATSSPAWLPNIISGKKQSSAFSVKDSVKIPRGSILKPIDHRNRGMSPEVYSDDESDCTSGEWRQTPRRSTQAASVGRRCGGRSTQLSRNVSGISFCLSPMVRASPCQNWSHKGGGAPPEMVVSGEIRVPITAAFCKSRSRKLADIGRSSHNR